MPSACAPRTPQEAGATTKDVLLTMAREYPHLRPCPKKRGSQGTMDWIARTACATCPLRPMPASATPREI